MTRQIVITENNIFREDAKTRNKELIKRRMKGARRSRLEKSNYAHFRNLAIIVGAMKAGTSTLYHYLTSHPNIVPNEFAKEPDFFCYNKKHRDNFCRGFEWYKAQWQFDCTKHIWAMEASTSYTKYPKFSQIYSRMKDSPFNFKFIYILRDPIDRIESHIKHLLAKGKMTLETFNPSDPIVISPSLYARQIGQILESFDQSDLLLLATAELRSQPSEVFSRAVRFLNLPDYHFGTIYAQNTRQVLVEGSSWELPLEQKMLLAELVREDVESLINLYGFDAQKYFPTFWSLISDCAPKAKT